MLKMLLLSGLMVAASLWSGDAVAQKRIALVIGNSSYANVRPLPNPANDATAIADMFRAAHFDVVDASNNLGGLEMRRVFRDFAEKSRTADIAVVFYAGHGIEMDGTNYLLPVDSTLKRDLDVEDEAVSIDRVVRTLEPAKRLRLIILDACRDNPFVRTVRRTSETRSIGRGLAKIEPPTSDTLIAFAAKAGSTASDGDGTHSPFTVALLKNLTTPGLDLRIALGRVRDDVMEATGNKQEPFVYGSLGGSTVTLVPAPQVAMPSSAAPSGVDIRRDYELAAQVGTKEAWNSFLSIHSGGFYADLARGQRGKLLAEEAKLASRTEPRGDQKPHHHATDRDPANRHSHRSEARCAGDAVATDNRDRPRASHRSGAEQARPRRHHAAVAHRIAAARLLSGRGRCVMGPRFPPRAGTVQPPRGRAPRHQAGKPRRAQCGARQDRPGLPAGMPAGFPSRQRRLRQDRLPLRLHGRRQWRVRARAAGEIQVCVAAEGARGGRRCRQASAPLGGR